MYEHTLPLDIKSYNIFIKIAVFFYLKSIFFLIYLKGDDM